MTSPTPSCMYSGFGAFDRGGRFTAQPSLFGLPDSLHRYWPPPRSGHTYLFAADVTAKLGGRDPEEAFGAHMICFYTVPHERSCEHVPAIKEHFVRFEQVQLMFFAWHGGENNVVAAVAVQ